MSSFEFLSVLISVVVGLGLANMFTGLGRLVHRRKTVSFSLAHAGWSVHLFSMMVVYWWTVVFGWQDYQNWNILIFLFILVYGFALFMLSALLYPSEVPERWDLREHFREIRGWFFAFYFLWFGSEMLDTWLKDHFDDFSWPYALVMTSWAATALWAWASRHRWVHDTVAIFQAATLISWILYGLRDLEWARAWAS